MTAASRIVPSQDTSATLPYDALTWQNKVHREVAALWKYIAAPLTSVGGTADAITATSVTGDVSAISAYATGQKFSIIPTATNTTAVTLNVDAVGVKSIKDCDGSALTAGDMVSGRQYLLEYDGTNFRLQDGSQPTTTGSAAPDIIARDEKTTGTNGGTFTSGSFVTRTINTLVRNASSLGALASNEITLPAGTYYVEWSAPALATAGHQTRLYNVTDAAVIETGTPEFSGTGGTNQTRSFGSAVFTISSSKAIRLEHRCNTTAATTGLGAQTGLGAKEVYAWLNIWKTT